MSKQQTLTRVATSLLAGVMITSTPAEGLAVGYQTFLGAQGVHFSDERARCLISSGSGTQMSGDSNLAKIWNYLIQKGLNDNQAAGVLGNIKIESGQRLSPNVQEISKSWPNGGYGLVQWTGGRRTALARVINRDSELAPYYSSEYSKASDVDATTGIMKGVPPAINDKFLALELDYLVQEAQSRKTVDRFKHLGATEWAAVKASKTLREASDVWLYSFERPADQSAAHATEREKAGQAVLSQVKGLSAPVAGTSPSADTAAPPTDGGCGSGTSVGNGSIQALQATVLKYAWPNHAKGKTEKKPEYAAATKAAAAKKQYTGAGCHGGGVDCGAFVTRVMLDSGFEPGYNNNGSLTNNPIAGGTPVQMDWLEKNWQKLGRGSSIDVATLQPGDVAIRNGHTFMFVGKIPGFNSNIASASQCERAPMAGEESITDGSMTWFRKK